jgi:hypothetical protein
MAPSLLRCRPFLACGPPRRARRSENWSDSAWGCSGVRKVVVVVVRAMGSSQARGTGVEVLGAGQARNASVLPKLAEELEKPYKPFPLLTNRHVETIFAAFFRSLPRLPFRRECLRMPDGGTVALDWPLPDTPSPKAMLILLVSKFALPSRESALLESICPIFCCELFLAWGLGRTELTVRLWAARFDRRERRHLRAASHAARHQPGLGCGCVQQPGLRGFARHLCAGSRPLSLFPGLLPLGCWIGSALIVPMQSSRDVRTLAVFRVLIPKGLNCVCSSTLRSSLRICAKW